MKLFRRKPKVGGDASPDPPSAEETSKPHFPSGIKVLHESENAIVDICFVHGLAGDREATWAFTEGQKAWPETLLPTKLPETRILTFGYDAYYARVGPASGNGVPEHAANLVNDLVTNRTQCNATSRPLIFVVHSLGGLICKSALDYSRENPWAHLQDVFDSIIGIAFFGTPHRGSWMSAWANIPASVLGVWKSGNTKLLNALRTDSDMLKSIQESFSRMIMRGLKGDGKNIQVTCFYEEMPLPVIGWIVPQASATLESSLNFSIRENHMNMVKFESADDPNFGKLLGELQRWIKSIEASFEPNTIEHNHPTKSRREAPRHLPSERNSNFTGRVQDLKILSEKTAPKEQATARVAIEGLGGMGKTQLVLEYVYLRAKGDPDCAVFWISCVSRDTINQDYQAAIDALGDDVVVHKMDKNDDLALQKTLRDHLSKKDSGRWILVFDNVDDISIWEDSREMTPGVRGLIDCLPRSELGTILFTTRNHQIAIRLAQRNIVKLTEMDRDDSRQLLRNLVDESLAGPETEDEIEHLLSDLMCLPLAIAQAAYYINAKAITISDYLGLFNAQEEQTIELLGRGFEDGQQARHPVATTWLISFGAIKSENPLAADYISFMACTDSQDIPESILPSAPSPLAKLEAIGILRAYSFVSTHQSAVTLLSMHRLVHLAARNWLRIEKTLDIWTDRVTRKLTETLDGLRSRHWTEWRPSMPHASHVLARMDGLLRIDSPALGLLEKYAYCHSRMSRDREAEKCFIKCLDVYTTQGGASHPRVIGVKSQLAGLYIMQYRNEEAGRLLKSIEENQDLNDPDVLIPLANGYRNLGCFDEAARFGEKAMERGEAVYGPLHPRTLRAKIILIQVYTKQGQLDKAVELGEDTVAKSREAWGDSRCTWDAILTLSQAYAGKGRFDDAIEAHKEGLEMMRKKLGDDHPHTIAATLHLGIICSEVGRLDEAVKFTEEALQRSKETEGSIMLESLEIRSRIAIKQGEQAYALELMERCVGDSKRYLGPDHPDTARLQKEYRELTVSQDK